MLSTRFVTKLLLFVACLASAGYLGYRYWRNSMSRLALLPRTETIADGATFRNRLNMEFARLPAGKFKMGSPQGIADELPQREITFAQPFYLGKHEVTQLQWEMLMGGRPGQSQADNAPVTQVSWHEAQEFIKKLNDLNDGYVYRLPSEAEWEFAARAGEEGDYIKNLDEMAWHEKNSFGYIHVVGQKRPNAFGIYDIFGNAWEWCEDHAGDYRKAPTDGQPYRNPDAIQDAARSLRGACFSCKPDEIRAAFRASNHAHQRKDSIGFRLAARMKK
jgi:formylglycine-generating enzyme required for sulfatase activity